MPGRVVGVPPRLSPRRAHQENPREGSVTRLREDDPKTALSGDTPGSRETVILLTAWLLVRLLRTQVTSAQKKNRGQQDTRAAFTPRAPDAGQRTDTGTRLDRPPKRAPATEISVY